MSNQKNFASYYYNLQLHWERDIEQYRHNIEQKLNNNQGYEIEKMENWDFFVRLLKNYDLPIYPKKWKKDSDVRSLKSLDINDDEILYLDTYIYISLNHLDILSNSIGIISVLKAWKEIWTPIMLEFILELFWIKTQALEVLAICYKNSQEYIENVSKITRLKFQVASANLQKQIWLEDGDWLSKLFEIKDQLWGDTLSLEISRMDWLKKSAILDFWKKSGSTLKGSTFVTIEEAWKQVQQKIDAIRFKSTIPLNIENNDLNKEEVNRAMSTDFLLTIEKIKQEYSISK